MAVDESEVPRLKDLYQRGLKNGVRDIALIDRERIKEIEPNCEVSADSLSSRSQLNGTLTAPSGHWRG